ncbi:hypothetical protein [Streptomyces sp. NBC_01800]|uniref:hypothetical protein n=1 Tax=Streptomyces sp. NBC_01800 TaxID=2975945 RepID=UPI002DD94897|nr:hypothetical protein [Streptomyces sp. NBC_01800]WSA71697.1 hypothetical protein OIE65_34700 [Streptomyces sp. NBC_01800]
MGLFDRLTSTKRPSSGVAPRSAEEVRAALLAINGPDVPYRVRNATPKEGDGLVAEWRILEPALRTFFVREIGAMLRPAVAMRRSSITTQRSRPTRPLRPARRGRRAGAGTLVGGECLLSM